MTRSLKVGIVAMLLSASGCNEQAAAPENGAEQVPAANAVAAPAAVAHTDRASQFTSLAEKDCRTLEANEDEGGDWRGACPGIAPYSLELVSGDLRDDLVVVRGSAKTALAIPELVAHGAFDSLGETAEWRGKAGEMPDVLVARVRVADDKGISDSGSLVIARLGDRPCIVGVVPPMRDQSARARALADSKLPACLTR